MRTDYLFYDNMQINTLKSCFPLSENTYSVDTSKKFIPFDRAKDNVRDRPASLIVDICPFLIKTSSDLIVVDTGLGYQLANREYHIHHNIQQCGFHPEEVTIVLLSHLHKDHLGGAVYKDENGFHLMFTKANYFVQEGELKNSLGKNSSSYEAEKIKFLSQQPQLILLNGDGNINASIQYKISGGHTEFHQVFWIDTGSDKYFYGGDVLPQGSQLKRRFIAKYDFDGKESEELRREYGHKAATEGWICLFFHSSEIPMARVKETDDNRFNLEKV